jgi:hypothetical protein
MSSWDAPTGNWDSRQEPDGPSGRDEQGYQQGEPTGGYRTVQDGEGRLRAGRRGLPGYEQAQGYDQAPADYHQDSGYGQGSGYGQQPGYGSAIGPQPGYGSGSRSSGTGQMVRYGQRPADEPAYGGGPPFDSGPQATPNPLDAPSPFGSHASGPQRPAGPQGAVGYGEGATGAHRQYGAEEPTRSGWSDAGDRQGYGDRPGYGASASYGSPSAPGQGYGQSSFPPGNPGPDQGYGAQPGYGQPGYGQQGYGEPGYSQQGADQAGGFPPDGFGGPADRGGQDYSRPGAEPSDYPQNGYGENGYGQDGFGQDQQPGFGQDPGVTQAYGSQPGYGHNGQVTYAPDGYSQDGGYTSPGAGPGTRQNGYPPDSYSQDSYSRDAYSRDAYSQDAYGDHGGYGPDGYGPQGFEQQGFEQQGFEQQGFEQQGFEQQGFEQQGFEQPSAGVGPGYDDDFASGGRAPRSRPGSSRSGPRTPQRLSAARMVLYLAASVVGVVVIVFLVIHLAKSGGSTPAGGTPTTSATASTSPTATGQVSSYAFKQASSVGSYPLNQAAVNDLATAAKNQSAPIASSLQSKGVGRPGMNVIGIYNLGQVTSTASSAYKGIVFVGYDGTFNVTNAIKVVRAHLVSSRVVDPGPHGGEMVCGYNTSTGTGTETSECVWVTKSTLGMVQFIAGTTPVKYPGAPALALQVRQAVEVPAS